MKNLCRAAACGLAVVSVVSSSLHAQVPNHLHHQGRVTVNSVPFEGAGSFSFALLDGWSGTLLWSNSPDTSPVDGVPDLPVVLPVSRGIYSVRLGDPLYGAMASIPIEILGTPDLRLRVWFNDGSNGRQQLIPDQPLSPNGYLPASSVRTDTLANGAVTSAKLDPNLSLNTVTANVLIGGGGGITGLAAEQIESGTLSDLRLSSNIPRLDALINVHYGAQGAFASHPNLDLYADTTLLAGFYSAGTYGPQVRFHDSLGFSDIGRNGSGAFVIEALDVPHFVVTQGGDIGIGTVTPSRKLDVSAPGAVAMFSSTDPNNGGSVVEISNPSSGAGLKITQSNPSTGGTGVESSHSGSGRAILGTSAGNTAIEGSTATIIGAGVLGRNTAGGEAVVGIASHPDPTRNGSGVGAVVGRNDLIDGYGVRGFGSRNGSVGVYGQSGISGAANIAGRFENTGAFNTSDVLQVRSTAVCNLAVFSKSGANVARIDSSGRGFFNNGTQVGGADVAEVIESSGDSFAPGDVVEVDPNGSLQYRLSSTPSSTLVAGVITTQPGVLMGKGVDSTQDLPALALVGRVPVKVVLEGGPIRPGDLLVSSSHPGHAMRGDPDSVKPGTVLGKALQPLTASSGTIQMLVVSR